MGSSLLPVGIDERVPVSVNDGGRLVAVVVRLEDRLPRVHVVLLAQLKSVARIIKLDRKE